MHFRSLRPSSQQRLFTDASLTKPGPSRLLKDTHVIIFGRFVLFGGDFFPPFFFHSLSRKYEAKSYSFFVVNEFFTHLRHLLAPSGVHRCTLLPTNKPSWKGRAGGTRCSKNKIKKKNMRGAELVEEFFHRRPCRTFRPATEVSSMQIFVRSCGGKGGWVG